jgi:hypothetical protein
VEDSQAAADDLTLSEIDYNWESLKRVVWVVFRLATSLRRCRMWIWFHCGNASTNEFYSAHKKLEGILSKGLLSKGIFTKVCRRV